MATRIIFSLFALLPLIVLFSGMAMTPILAIIALTVTLLILKNEPKNAALYYPRYTLILAGLALILVPAIASSIWSITPLVTLKTSLSVAFLAAMGWVSFTYVQLLTPPGNKFLKAYGLCLVLVGLLIIQEVALGGGLIQYIYEHTGQSYNRFILKNVNRGLCAFTLFIWPFLAACTERGMAKKGWLMALPAMIGIMILHSLSAKLGLITSIAAFWGLQRFPQTLPRLFVLLVAVFLLCFPYAYHLLETEVFSIPVVQQHLAASGIHRLHIWHVLLEQVAERPWLGWGIDTTRAMPLSVEQLQSINLQVPPLHPHNPSIEIILEEGVIGLILSTAGILVLIREWIRMPLSEPLYRATAGTLIVAYAFTGVASFGIWQHWWMASFCLAGVLWRWLSLKRPVAVEQAKTL